MRMELKGGKPGALTSSPSGERLLTLEAVIQNSFLVVDILVGRPTLQPDSLALNRLNRAHFPSCCRPSQELIRESRMILRLGFSFLILAFAMSGVACNRTQISRRLDFNQDVQPILASRCFACHGPDPEMRKASLRLDLAEWAMKKRDGRRDAIVPGHPEKSELVERIESKDPKYLMRQTAQGEAKPMSAREIAILKEWIKQGAMYRPHWAFEVPNRPAVPRDSESKVWAKNPIDNFIFVKLKEESLQPSPEAN